MLKLILSTNIFAIESCINLMSNLGYPFQVSIRTTVPKSSCGSFLKSLLKSHSRVFEYPSVSLSPSLNTFGDENPILFLVLFVAFTLIFIAANFYTYQYNSLYFSKKKFSRVRVGRPSLFVAIENE